MNKARRELLVNGYVRQQENQYNLSNIIPDSIYVIIFQFQLLIEIWNKELSKSRAQFSDDCCIVTIPGKTDASSCVTLYGDHIVKYGDNFEWRLTLLEQKRKEPNFVLGLIPNKIELLTKYKSEYLWYKESSNGGAFGFGTMTGQVGHRAKSHSYSAKNVFSKEGDVLEMKLNWKDSVISFTTNGKNWGNMLGDNRWKLPQDTEMEYCLIFSIIYANDIKLMIEGYCV